MTRKWIVLNNESNITYKNWEKQLSLQLLFWNQVDVISIIHP